MIYWVGFSLWMFFRSLIKETHGTCIVIYYHEVKYAQRYKFAQQMDVLIRLAKPLSSENNSPLIPGVHYVVVTFDDGFQSIVDNAIPELIARDIPSSIFIPTGNIGQEPKWETTPGYDIERERIVTEKQIRELPRRFVTIGSHSITHRKLTALGEQDAWGEFHESRLILESISGNAVSLFSYPHGECSEQLHMLARDAGYTRVFTSAPAFAFKRPQEYVTGRVSVNPTDWNIEFVLKLRGAYSWLPFASSLKKKVLKIYKRLSSALT